MHRLLDAFPRGGIIAGPAHNIQPGTPAENVVAAYQAIHSHFGLCKPELEMISVTSVSGENAHSGT